MRNHRLNFIPFVCFLSLLTISSSHIYDVAPAFYSQRCYFGAKTTSTFSCALTTAQTGVIRIGLAISQYYKNQWSYWSFQVTTSTPVGSVSSVSISLTDIEPKTSQPSYVNEFGFFVVCIKSQPTTKYVDLLLYSCGAGTTMDNRDVGDRSVTTPMTLSGNTIFSSGAGLSVLPFTTSFKVEPKYSSGTTRDWYFIMHYIFAAVINGNDVDVTLTAKSQIKLSGFKGIIIVFDPVTTTATTPIQMKSVSVFLNGRWPVTEKISTRFPDFGPNFDGKCIMGFHTLKFAGGVPMIHALNNNTFSHYYQYQLSLWGSGCGIQVSGFCFGADNSTLCGDEQNYTDPLDGQCYRAATCPLPVPAVWTTYAPSPGVCPMCRQLICQSCPLSNRGDCQDCGPNTVLTSGVCSCLTPNYYPFTVSISTGSQGLWANTMTSLQTCKINCTYHIANCLVSSCTSTTFCTGCQNGYHLDYVDASTQNCKLCSLSMTGCATCSSATVCLTCSTGFYYDGSSACIPCTSPCNGCSGPTTCTSCVTGYTYATGTCTCNPTSSGLTNCATCTSSTQCATCNAPYVLSTSDYRCYSCTAIHAQCLTCSDQNTCLTCASTWIPSVVEAVQTCTTCASHIINCNTCSSTTVCTACITGYFVGTGGTSCDSCSGVVTGCSTCSSSSTCTGCTSGYTFGSGTCTCNVGFTPLANCATCTIPTQCTACTSTAFYLLSSDSKCYSCTTIHAQCLTCSDQSTCLTCGSTYVTSMVSGVQTCTLCSSHITNCNTCSSTTVCTACVSGYFTTGGGAACSSCSGVVTGCSTCSGSSTCTGCTSGYTFGSGTCTCNVGFTPLANCATCTIPTQCTGCTSTAFYIKSSDSKCYACTTIHAQCLTCSDQSTCLTCASTWIPSVVGAVQTCTTCASHIINCNTCLSTTVCTACVSGYFTTGGGSACSSCSGIVTGCSTCSSSTTCTGCSSGYTFGSGTCTCNVGYTPLANCATCTIPTQCTACTSTSFYLSTGTHLCVPCYTIHSQCQTCANVNTCSTCNPGYTTKLVSTTTTCVQCSGQITNCIQCSNPTTCTQCAGGYYVLASGQCQACSVPFIGCNLCTNVPACTGCTSGYTLTPPTCKCNVGFTPLANCATCTIPTQCTACVSNAFYISTSTFQCVVCSSIHIQCLTCTNQNTCNTCAATYTTKIVATVQTCSLCSSQILNCVLCSSPTTCTQCLSTYYVLSSGQCDLCSNPLLGCSTCSSSTVCTGCLTGYTLNSPICKCNPGYTPLNNCATCTIPSQCTSCVSTAFYLSTTDHLCHSCSIIHSQCSNCSDFNTCTLCVLPYVVWTFANTTVGCQICIPLVQDCTFCYHDPNACINCDFLYGLTSSAQCQRCNILLGQPECESCEDASGCLTCFVGSTAIAGQCHYCRTLVPKCTVCAYITTISQTDCSQCQSGYLPILNNLIGVHECKSCKGFINFCTDCSSTTVCTACSSPYLVGPDGICSSCQPGYQFMSGYCTKLSGCISLYRKPDGTEVCLACLQPLHFAFDPIHMNCECAKGYQPYTQIGKLTQCLPVCGDGILASGDEECDDKNTISKDGCSDKCKIEPNFVCSTSQPSKCVLYVNFNVFSFNHGSIILVNINAFSMFFQYFQNHTSIKVTFQIQSIHFFGIFYNFEICEKKEIITVIFGFNHVYRVLGENKGIMSFTISPIHEGLEKMNWAQLLKFNFSSSTVDPSSLSYSYNVDTGELQVTVPYNEELQNSVLQAEITFNPNMIVSLPDKITIANKLNGVNAPLIFESSLMLSTYKNISLISLIMALLLLLQFYVGSYFHKMIGLETIQVIQAVYFARMLSKSSSSSLLSSMNVLEYSATGYENAHLLYGDLTDIQNHAYTVMDREFLEIGMKSFYLLNVNLSLLPIVIVIAVYIVSFARKALMRNLYIETREQEKKDRYTMLRRSCQWVYDHFVFPSTMLFSLISFFYTILELTKHDPKDSQSEVTSPQQLEVSSFYVHLIVLFMTTGIYCFEVFASYSEYVRYKMTPEEKQKIPESMVQKLEHDENYLDRANYHPLYVLVYLLYYFLLSLVMVFSALVESFTYTLEVTLGLSVAYFLIICFWKPYHNSVNIHNHLLKLYYLTFVLFLVIEYLMTKSVKLPSSLHVVLMYMIMSLLGCILTIGIIRIWLQRRFKISLKKDNTLLNWNKNDISQIKDKSKDFPQNKKLSLLTNNQYVFQNQLQKMRKQSKLNKSQQKDMERQYLRQFNIPPQQKQYLIGKIRQQIAIKRSSILENLINTNINLQKQEFNKSSDNSNKTDKEFQQQTTSNKFSQYDKNNEREDLKSLKRRLRNEWKAINQ